MYNDNNSFSSQYNQMNDNDRRNLDSLARSQRIIADDIERTQAKNAPPLTMLDVVLMATPIVVLIGATYKHLPMINSLVQAVSKMIK